MKDNPCITACFVLAFGIAAVCPSLSAARLAQPAPAIPDIEAVASGAAIEAVDNDPSDHMAVPVFDPRRPPGLVSFEPAFAAIDAQASKDKAAVSYTGPAATAAYVNQVYRFIFGRNATTTESTRWTGQTQAKVWHEVFLEKGSVDLVGGNKPMELMHVSNNLYADAATVKEIFYFPSGSDVDYILPLRWVGSGNPDHYSGFLGRFRSGPFAGTFRMFTFSGGKILTAQQRDLMAGLLASSPASNFTVGLGTRVYTFRRSGGTTVFATDQNLLHQNNTTVYAYQAFHTTLNFQESGIGQGMHLAEGILDPAVGGTIPIVRIHNCFVAGTPVWTERGLVPIEDIRVGDRVLSTSETTGKSGYKPVLKTFVNPAPGTVRIRFADTDEVIEATLEHPFRVMGYKATGWAPAGELREGDVVLTNTGAGMVAGVEFSQAEVTTYNFEVADWNTYHVGTGGWMVHNRSSLPSVPTPMVPGVESLTMTFGAHSEAAKTDGSAHTKILPAIVVAVATTVGRFGVPAYHIGRGLLQGMAGSGSSNAVLGIGRISATPNYVQASISAGYRYYSTSQWTLGHNLGFVFGHALRHGSSSVRLVTNSPIAGSVTASELGSAYLAGAARTGVTIGTTAFLQNSSVHPGLGTDFQFWFGAMPNVPYVFPLMIGGQISSEGGGPMFYQYPTTSLIIYAW